MEKVDASDLEIVAFDHVLVKLTSSEKLEDNLRALESAPTIDPNMDLRRFRELREALLEVGQLSRYSKCKSRQTFVLQNLKNKIESHLRYKSWSQHEYANLRIIKLTLDLLDNYARECLGMVYNLTKQQTQFPVGEHLLGLARLFNPCTRFRVPNLRVARIDVRSIDCALSDLRNQKEALLNKKDALRKLAAIIEQSNDSSASERLISGITHTVDRAFDRTIVEPCYKLIDSPWEHAADIVRLSPLSDEYFTQVKSNDPFFLRVNTALMCRLILTKTEELKRNIVMVAADW